MTYQKGIRKVKSRSWCHCYGVKIYFQVMCYQPSRLDCHRREIHFSIRLLGISNFHWASRIRQIILTWCSIKKPWFLVLSGFFDSSILVSFFIDRVHLVRTFPWKGRKPSNPGASHRIWKKDAASQGSFARHTKRQCKDKGEGKMLPGSAKQANSKNQNNTNYTSVGTHNLTHPHRDTGNDDSLVSNVISLSDSLPISKQKNSCHALPLWCRTTPPQRRCHVAQLGWGRGPALQQS